MSQFISGQSKERLSALSAAFDAVEENEQLGVELDKALEASGERDNKGFYRLYEIAQTRLIEQQTDAVQRLGTLVVSTERKAIENEIETNPRLNFILVSPSYTKAKLASVDDKKITLLNLLGSTSEEEADLVESAGIAATNRLGIELADQTETASSALDEVEALQVILQRPLPDFTLAGETADVIKPILRTMTIDPSGKKEVSKSRRGEVQKRFIALMIEKRGVVMNSTEISELLYPKDFRLNPRLAAKRTQTMLAKYFAGESDSYVRALSKKGVKLQRLAHRHYVENGNDTDLRQVHYEYRPYGGDVEKITQKTYTSVIPGGGIIEHSWESPIKKVVKP